MRKASMVRRMGVVAVATAGLLGIGGATSTAFAQPTDPIGLTTNPCPDGYIGIIVSVNHIPVVVCTNI